MTEYLHISDDFYLHSHPEGGYIHFGTGEYKYPFSFGLPLEIPSTYNSRNGNVNYKLTVVLIKGFFSKDFSFQTKLPISGVVDLNTMIIPKDIQDVHGPEFSSLELENNRWLASPVETTKEKRLCCMCCQSGPIALRLTINKTGYVSGEFVHFKIEVVNNTGRNVTTGFQLLQRVELYFEKKSKKVSDYSWKTLAKVRGPAVGPFAPELWDATGNEMEIMSSYHVTNLGGGTIIQVSYFVKAKLGIQRGGQLNTSIPIIIGNVPLKEELNFITPVTRKIFQDSESGCNTCLYLFLAFVLFVAAVILSCFKDLLEHTRVN